MKDLQSLINELELRVDVKRRFITGNNGIYFEAVQNFDSLQIDLTQKFKIEKIKRREMKPL